MIVKKKELELELKERKKPKFVSTIFVTAQARLLRRQLFMKVNRNFSANAITKATKKSEQTRVAINRRLQVQHTLNHLVTHLAVVSHLFVSVSACVCVCLFFLFYLFIY